MAKNSLTRALSKKGLGIGGTFALAMNAYGATSDYNQKRLEGHSKTSSLISAAGNAVMFEAIGLTGMLAMGATTALPDLAVKGFMKANSTARSMDRSARNTPFTNSTFADSQQAFTMRQAGMQLAQASKYNMQQTLMGNEASVMHRL